MNTHRIVLNVNNLDYISLWSSLSHINFQINKLVNAVARGVRGRTLSYEPSLVIAAVRSPKRRKEKQLAKAAETPLKYNVSKT